MRQGFIGMRTVLLVVAVVAIQIGLYLYLGSVKEPEPRPKPVVGEAQVERPAEPVAEEAPPEPEPESESAPCASELFQKAIREIIETCDGTLAVFYVKTGFRILEASMEPLLVAPAPTMV